MTVNKDKLIRSGLLARDLSRRDFLARATALGLTAAAAQSLYATEARASTPKRGGTLRLGINNASTTDSLDPGTFAASYMMVVGTHFYNWLLEVDPAGQLIPSLATSWESRPGVKEWVIKLREGVTFHNGKSFGPADVVYSINYHRDENSKSAARSLVSNIVNVKETAPNEVTFTLEQGDVDFPYILTDYHLAMLAEGQAPTSGIGTGAFVLEKFEPNVSTLGVRNPNYWNSERGFIDAVETIAINDPVARMTALINGSVHMINQVDPQTYTRLGAVTGIVTHSTPGRGYYTFSMRTDLDPFSNHDLRLAVMHAVNRQELVDKVLHGHGVVGNDHPLAQADPDFSDAIEQRPFDLDKAKFHYKKSGHSGKLPLSVSEVAFVGATNAGVLMQETAAKAGIDIEIVRQPNDGYWTNVWLKELWCAVYYTGRPTANMQLSLCYKSDAPWNDSFWKRPEFDKILLDARVELDEQKRKTMYHDMLRMIHSEGGTLIPLFYNALEASSDKVKGYQPLPILEMSGLRVAEKVWLEE